MLPDEAVLSQQGAGSVVEAGGLDGAVEAEEVRSTAPCGLAVEPVADVLLLHGWAEHPLVAVAGGGRVAAACSGDGRADVLRAICKSHGAFCSQNGWTGGESRRQSRSRSSTIR